PHDPGRAAPAPDERCRRPRHRPDRADRPGRPARPRPCRQASATLCVAEDSDRRASRPSSGVVLSVSEPIPPTGGWCTSCPCRTASTCGCTCATTHRDSMIFQAKISTTISHYFAEPRAAFQLPQAISKACHGPHLPHRQKSPLKNGSWANPEAYLHATTGLNEISVLSKCRFRAQSRDEAGLSHGAGGVHELGSNPSRLETPQREIRLPAVQGDG